MDEERKFKKPESKPEEGDQGPDAARNARCLTGDLLRGGTEIGEFLTGERSESSRRQAYHLAETSRLPVFKLGSTLCMRKSTFFAWVTQQERRAWLNKGQPKQEEIPPKSKGADRRETDDEAGK